MTQEDWSGTGETSQTSNAGSWSEPSADAADETWGESAIGETDDGAERAIAVPATDLTPTPAHDRPFRSSSRSRSR